MTINEDLAKMIHVAVGEAQRLAKKAEEEMKIGGSEERAATYAKLALAYSTIAEVGATSRDR